MGEFPTVRRAARIKTVVGFEVVTSAPRLSEPKNLH